MKLPKQWNRWIKKAGLVNTYSSDLARCSDAYYFKGYGRLWRLNCHDMLEISQPLEEFDRWANSVESRVTMNATNEKEFIALVKGLVTPDEV